MKVCIFGAGAIGGFLSHGLAGVDQVELSLIARGRNLTVLKSQGLTLVRGGIRDTVAVRATDDPADLGPQDYVIVALKAHQAWESAERLEPLLGPDTAVITCQNGVPWWYFHELEGPYRDQRLRSVDAGNRQWERIGPERAIGCAVYPASELSAPGTVQHVYGNKFALGEPDGSVSERCRRLADALEAGGFKAPVLDNIRDELWLKLWGNLCFNPISALTRATLDVVATDPGTRAIADAMMREAEDIATRLGVRFRVTRERRINGAAGVGPHRTSMLQDLESGRAMEIDALVTAVQEMGRIVGVGTPTLDGVLSLVTQLGRSQGCYGKTSELAADPPPAAASR